MRRRRRQHGAALIVAMLVAALAAVVAVTLAADGERWLRTFEQRRDQVQAQSLALAGIQWARQVLQEDAARGPVDHAGEPWALPLPPTPVDRGTVEGRIEDAQARFNVNNLAGTGAEAAIERARIGRLFTRLAIEPVLLDAITDWIDEDSVPRERGAEDADYATAGGLAANAPAGRLTELAGVRGMTGATVVKLAPYVAALPGTTALNVNTASPEVLAAALPDIDEAALATLVAGRSARPFLSIDDFRARLPLSAQRADMTGFGVGSALFVVSVRARQGDSVTQARALLARRAGAWPVVVWQVVE